MTDNRHNTRDIFPPTGPEITAKSWQTEAPMRMLMNNLHPDVAENPHELVVYGGIGRAARTWEDFDRMVAALKVLKRQALHAEELSFLHPKTQERLTFHAELPEDICKVLELMGS